MQLFLKAISQLFMSKLPMCSSESRKVIPFDLGKCPTSLMGFSCSGLESAWDPHLCPGYLAVSVCPEVSLWAKL